MTPNLTDTIATLAGRVERLLQDQQTSEKKTRIVLALAGVPGSGKSTVSSALISRLAEDGINDVALLPMDGFHYTKAILSTFSDPEKAFRRRGAPFTYDAQEFIHLVRRLKQMPVTDVTEPEYNITAPDFDHAVGDPVPDAIVLTSRCRAVVVEGNYTLLSQEPWSDIAKLADEKWFVDVPPEMARERLAARHLSAGISSTREEAISRAEENDLPNGDLVRRNLIEPDVRIIN